MKFIPGEGRGGWDVAAQGDVDADRPLDREVGQHRHRGGHATRCRAPRRGLWRGDAADAQDEDQPRPQDNACPLDLPHRRAPSPPSPEPERSQLTTRLTSGQPARRLRQRSPRRVAVPISGSRSSLAEPTIADVRSSVHGRSGERAPAASSRMSRGVAPSGRRDPTSLPAPLERAPDAACERCLILVKSSLSHADEIRQRRGSSRDETTGPHDVRKRAGGRAWRLVPRLAGSSSDRAPR